MTALQEAQSALPLWVGFGSLLYWAPGAFLVGLLATWLSAEVALRPFRQAAGLHWSGAAGALA